MTSRTTFLDTAVFTQTIINLQSHIIFYGVILYLLSLIIDAPMRYVMFLAGVPYLINLRDIFMAFIILVYIINVLISGKIHKNIVIIFFLLIFHSMIGILFIGNILQILFGLKVIMPLIIGIIFYPLFISKPKRVKVILSIFYLIVITGVYLNVFKQYPWEGLTYDVIGQTIEGTREWSTFGVKRIAGFARASFNTAIQLIILAIFLVSYLGNKWIKVFLWLLAGPAILLTTSKGILMVYIILSLFLIIYKIVPNFNNIYQKLLIIPILLMILLPVYAYFYYDQNVSQDFITNPLLWTMYQRMEIWPDNIAFIRKSGDTILGRGIGGVGMSQHIFEKRYSLPGDNLFVYGFGYFGILSIFYFLYIYKLAQNIDLKSNLFPYLLLMVLFFYGIVSNVMEDSFFMIFLGICLRNLWPNPIKKQIKYEEE
jgi:hypothetical protein